MTKSDKEIQKIRVDLAKLNAKFDARKPLSQDEWNLRKKYQQFFRNRQPVAGPGGEMMSRSQANNKTMVAGPGGEMMSRSLANSKTMVAGPGGEMMSRSQANNNTPAHKKFNRKSQKKKEAIAKDFKALNKPHVETLLENRSAVVTFVNKNPALKNLMTSPLSSISALDSATGSSKWNSSKNAGNSRDGKDLRRFAIYNEDEEMWLEGWIMTPVDGNGKPAKSGGKRSDYDIRWKFFTWPKDEWVAPGSDDVRIGDELTEAEAQDRLVDFVGDTTILEYNNCDHLRINSWLAINGKGPLKFFDMCRSVCMSLSDNIQSFFGPKRQAISPSVNARLETISIDLFVVGGPSNVGPEEGTAAHTAGIFPHLTEISVVLSYSDDTLDVQTLFNLFVLLRCIYGIGCSDASGSDSDSSGSDSATKAAVVKKKAVVQKDVVEKGRPKKRRKRGGGR